MQQGLGQPVREVLVVLVVRHVDERQDCDRGCADRRLGDVGVFARLPRAEQADEDDEHDDADDRDVIEHLARPRLDPLGIAEFVLALDALRGHLVKPGKDDGRDEAECEDQDYGPRRPRWRAEFGKYGRQHFCQEPAHHEVGCCDAKHVAAPEFGHQGHQKTPYGVLNNN